MFYKILKAKTSIESLTVYRELLNDKVISALSSVFEDLVNEKTIISQFVNHYSGFFYNLIEQNSETNFKEYIIKRVIYLDNVFSKQSEKLCYDKINNHLKKAVECDLMCLNNATLVSARDIKEAAINRFGPSEFDKDIIENLPEWDSDNVHIAEDKGIIIEFKSTNRWNECIKPLADFYRINGSGEFSKYQGFVWEKDGVKGSLKGISSLDPIRLSELIGYEAERKEVINNTLQFINGYPANNVLLYGDRGTGKSSTVKAILNEYSHLGLRIIELPKAFLHDLHCVIRLIKDRNQKFIIFVDDLAFGDSEEEYTALKAILEGGLESKPQNVIVYATSNRRHLIKERFSDRTGLMSGNHDDEVHASDTLQEKLSLADRFGITVTFSSPDKKRFLEIVEGIAKNRNLDVNPATLQREALIWEMNYNGRSPRTARQFIDWLEGQLSKEQPLNS